MATCATMLQEGTPYIAKLVDVNGGLYPWIMGKFSKPLTEDPNIMGTFNPLKINPSTVVKTL